MNEEVRKIIKLLSSAEPANQLLARQLIRSQNIALPQELLVHQGEIRHAQKIHYLTYIEQNLGSYVLGRIRFWSLFAIVDELLSFLCDESSEETLFCLLFGNDGQALGFWCEIESLVGSYTMPQVCTEKLDEINSLDKYDKRLKRKYILKNIIGERIGLRDGTISMPHKPSAWQGNWLTIAIKTPHPIKHRISPASDYNYKVNIEVFLPI